MINELREFLVDKDVNAMNITRLEVRSDLKRGDKKRIWMALAKMLRAGGEDRSVMAQDTRGDRYCFKNQTFWIKSEAF